VVTVDNVHVTVLRGGFPAAAFPEPVAAPAAPAAPAIPEVPDVPVIPDDPIAADPPADDGDDGDEGDDEGEDDPQIELPEQDLYVVSVAFRNTFHMTGSDVTVEMRISNGGTRALGPFAVAWESMGSSCEVEVDGLPALTSLDVSCTAPGLPAGIHTWTVYVDHDDRIAEADKSNNSLTSFIEVSLAVQPDLFVSNVVAYDDPVEGAAFLFEVYIEDHVQVIGFDGAYTATFLMDGQLVCSNDESGGFSVSTCLFPGVGAGDHLIEVYVDTEDEVDEIREDNNHLIRQHHVIEG